MSMSFTCTGKMGVGLGWLFNTATLLLFSFCRIFTLLLWVLLSLLAACGLVPYW